MLRDQSFIRLSFLVVGVETFFNGHALNHIFLSAVRKAQQGKFFHYRLIVLGNVKDYSTRAVFEEHRLRVSDFLDLSESFYLERAEDLPGFLQMCSECSGIFSPVNSLRPEFLAVRSLFWTKGAEAFIAELAECSESPKIFKK